MTKKRKVIEVNTTYELDKSKLVEPKQNSFGEEMVKAEPESVEECKKRNKILFKCLENQLDSNKSLLKDTYP